MSAPTDRELLERAAKAAGLYDDGYRAQFRDGDGWVCIRPADATCPFQSIWAPYTDDGDALRLAVRLRISIRLHEQEAGAHDGCEPYGDDPYAATRRAIVRAAAEMAQ